MGKLKGIKMAGAKEEKKDLETVMDLAMDASREEVKNAMLDNWTALMKVALKEILMVGQRVDKRETLMDNRKALKFVLLKVQRMKEKWELMTLKD